MEVCGREYGGVYMYTVSLKFLYKWGGVSLERIIYILRESPVAMLWP